MSSASYIEAVATATLRLKFGRAQNTFDDGHVLVYTSTTMTLLDMWEDLYRVRSTEYCELGIRHARDIWVNQDGPFSSASRLPKIAAKRPEQV